MSVQLYGSVNCVCCTEVSVMSVCGSTSNASCTRVSCLVGEGCMSVVKKASHVCHVEMLVMSVTRNFFLRSVSQVCYGSASYVCYAGVPVMSVMQECQLCL